MTHYTIRENDDHTHTLLRYGEPAAKPEPTNAELEFWCEIERLRAIVDMLPKTEDGVPIVPGMTMSLWYRSPAGIVEAPPPETWADVWSIADSLNQFYSARAAAEAAGGSDEH